MTSNCRDFLHSPPASPSPFHLSHLRFYSYPKYITRCRGGFLHRTLVVEWDLRAQFGRRQEPLVAERIALGGFRSEHEEFIVLHWQSELLGDVAVVGGGFVAGAAGTVEPGSRVDARGRDVTVVCT